MEKETFYVLASRSFADDDSEGALMYCVEGWCEDNHPYSRSFLSKLKKVNGRYVGEQHWIDEVLNVRNTETRVFAVSKRQMDKIVGWFEAQVIVHLQDAKGGPRIYTF